MLLGADLGGSVEPPKLKKYETFQHADSASQF